MKRRKRKTSRLTSRHKRWTPFIHAGKKTASMVIDGKLESEVSDQYINSHYRVAKFDDGDIIHLSIKRLDGTALQDWRELQRIKNEILGDEVEAVQLYPAESRLVDMCNQIHLWALKKDQFPFGFSERVVMEGTLLPGQTQRPFDKKPHDLRRAEDGWDG